MSPIVLIATLVAIPNGISTPPSVTQTIEAPSAPEGSGPEWTASVQGGGGRLSEDPVAMLRPRLTLTGQQFRVALSAPLFLKIADEGPVAPSGGSGPVSWTNNFHDGETYASWIEEFQYTSKHGAVDLRLGQLRRQTLGHGTLVDNYTASYDPSQPRSGGRFVVSTDTVEAKLISDGLIRPRLIAASITLAPFQIDNREAEDAFTVALEVATDMRAPVIDGTTQIGGADVVLTGAPYIGDELMWSLYFAMGSFYTQQVSGALGSHLGTELQWARGHEALLLRLEGTVSGRGYDPAYFDDQYSAERASLSTAVPTSKADLVAPSGYGTRGRAEFTNGPFTIGTSFEHSFASSAGKPTRASLYTEWTAEMWHIAARISQRAMRDSGDWFALGDRSMALVDASVRITGDWFAYTLLHHGVRQGDNGLVTPVSDWILGVGYGVAGTLDRL